MPLSNSSPLPATGFRSGDGWTDQQIHAAGEDISTDFDFVEGLFGKKERVNTIIRIFSLARQLNCKFLLVEQLADDAPLKQEEDDAVRANDFDFERSKFYRFSFFNCPIEQEPNNNNFLGYAVVRKEFYKNASKSQRVYVYESVIRPYRTENDSGLSGENFLHCKRKYLIKINGYNEDFSVVGAMYAQQNGKNFVCAHVALRSVLSLLGNEDISYSEINTLARRPPHSRDGLTVAQIDNVLKGRGMAMRRMDKGEFPRMGLSSFSPVLYDYVESGCPALLAFFPFNAQGHIVPVFGPYV